VGTHRTWAVGFVMVSCAAANAAQVQSTWIVKGDGLWGAAANWSPNAVPNNGGGTTYLVLIDAAGEGSVSLDLSPTIDGLQIGAGSGVVMGDTYDLTVVGGAVANEGVIEMASQGGLTDLKLGVDTVLDGAGMLALSANLNNRIFGSPGIVRLTHGADHTITGAGSFGANLMRLTNNGVIVGSSMVFPLVLDLSGTDNFNHGVLRAENGTLQIAGTTLDNTDGVIEALDGGVVTFGGTSAITAGLLRTEGSGVMRLTGTTTFTNVSFDGSMTVLNDVDPIFVGTFSNDGEIAVASRGANTDLRISGDVTLNGFGQVILGNNKNNRMFGLAASNRLTIGPDQTIRGAGQIGVNFMALTNHGAIVADALPGLTIDPAGGGFENHGLLAVEGEGSLAIAAGPFTTDGLVTVGRETEVTRTGDFFQTGGLVDLRGELEIVGGSYHLNGGTLAGDGLVGTNLIVTGGILNPGSPVGVIVIDGDYNQDAGGLLQFEAAGPRFGEYDAMDISGTATLSGNFAMTVTAAFKPLVGDVFTVLTADKVEGEFDCAQFLGVPQGNGVIFVYEPDRVRVKVLEVPPTDFDDSGFVDGADLGLMLSHWGKCDETCCQWDLDGSNFVEANDLGILLATWGSDGVIEKGETY
jgi:hypothetical protein